jgi:hypothetical protein
MKSRDQKYKEAVERCLRAASTHKRAKYASSSCTSFELRIKLGIRGDDHQFDAAVSKLFGEIQKERDQLKKKEDGHG